jgi:hypothetical protein
MLYVSKARKLRTVNQIQAPTFPRFRDALLQPDEKYQISRGKQQISFISAHPPATAVLAEALKALRLARIESLFRAKLRVESAVPFFDFATLQHFPSLALGIRGIFYSRSYPKNWKDFPLVEQKYNEFSVPFQLRADRLVVDVTALDEKYRWRLAEVLRADEFKIGTRTGLHKIFSCYPATKENFSGAVRRLPWALDPRYWNLGRFVPRFQGAFGSFSDALMAFGMQLYGSQGDDELIMTKDELGAYREKKDPTTYKLLGLSVRYTTADFVHRKRMADLRLLGDCVAQEVRPQFSQMIEVSPYEIRQKITEQMNRFRAILVAEGRDLTEQERDEQAATAHAWARHCVGDRAREIATTFHSGSKHITAANLLERLEQLTWIMEQQEEYLLQHFHLLAQAKAEELVFLPGGRTPTQIEYERNLGTRISLNYTSGLWELRVNTRNSDSVFTSTLREREAADKLIGAYRYDAPLPIS